VEAIAGHIMLGEQNPAEKEMRLKRLSIDGALLQGFEFQGKTGYSGKHPRVGVKASLVVDATGLPLSAVIASGNAHDLSLAEEGVSRLRGYDYFHSSLLADKGYDSKKFPRFAFNQGIKPNIPKRFSMKEREHPYKDHLSRYETEEAKHRFIVERTNAWFKSFRRLRNRFDYQMASFEAFLYLAIIIMCVRRLVL
jgi:transposase